MRTDSMMRQGHFGRKSLMGMAVLTLGMLAGCQSGDQRAIHAAADALRVADYDQATILANTALEESSTPEIAAEALYIRGRAHEQRPVISRGQLDLNLQAARNAYIDALRRNPPRKLETYLHASLGKVAFFQDDFATAIKEMRIAYGQLGEKNERAAALYYIGKSQQRLGQFLDADKTLTQVMEDYDESPWAKKAGEARGARAFYVQLVTYSNPAMVDPAVRALRQRKIEPQLFIDRQQRRLLRIGPLTTFAQAKAMRDRASDLFPDATVIP